MIRADIVVVGTGAAAVSVAFPLVEAGFDVTLVDPGVEGNGQNVPDREYLRERRESTEQWRWLLGQSLEAGASETASSPKFRVPTLSHVFAGFGSALGIQSEGFSLVGSLATGGLTTAWGGGVAQFSNADLRDFPITLGELEPHYRSVAARIGISGEAHDDLSSYFGLDGLTMPPSPLDRVGSYVAHRYRHERDWLRRHDFAMGRARLAVLSADRGDRRACNARGLCLWGCPRQSIYAASQDLKTLQGLPNAHHRHGLLVENLRRTESGWLLGGIERANGAAFQICARTVIIAAGVIATTRLVLALTGTFQRPIRLLSTPTAAMALFLPAVFGRTQEPGVGLAQHWYTLGEGEDEICGGLFPTTGLPVAEFVSRTPLTKGVAIDVMRWLLPAMTVGNIFVHSRYSDNFITLREDGRLVVTGGFKAGFEGHLANAAKRLRRIFRRLGAITLPGSFAAGSPGSDAHYAGTLPMRALPGPLETTLNGELFGRPGLYIADGSVLPSLPAKSHTLTIMANAERIGTLLARSLKAQNG